MTADEAPRYPEVAEFVEVLMAQQGVATVADLATKLRLNVNERRQLYKYANGENRPGFTKLMPLLRAAGLLTTAPVSPAAASLEEARQAAIRLADEAEQLVSLLAAAE
ncbi:MAG TPA: hypothetical protein VM344_06785 [Vitreimonas sp.]|nr:hypothetical protein [Vitreimonas sp.]